MTAAVQGNWHFAFWSYKVKDTGSSWGLYTAKNGAPNIPDVSKDSYDQILKKWGSWDTPTYFTRNPMVADAVKKAANLRKSLHATSIPVQKAGNAFAVRQSGNALILGLPESGHWNVTLRDLRGKTVRSVRAESRVIEMRVAGVEPGVYTVTAQSTWSYSCRVFVGR
jgi:hypothetical protein